MDISSSSYENSSTDSSFSDKHKRHKRTSKNSRRRVVVENIPNDVVHPCHHLTNKLRDEFRECGTITNIKVFTEGKDYKGRYISPRAVITFETEKGAKRALRKKIIKDLYDVPVTYSQSSSSSYSSTESSYENEYHLTESEVARSVIINDIDDTSHHLNDILHKRFSTCGKITKIKCYTEGKDERGKYIPSRAIVTFKHRKGARRARNIILVDRYDSPIIAERTGHKLRRKHRNHDEVDGYYKKRNNYSSFSSSSSSSFSSYNTSSESFSEDDNVHSKRHKIREKFFDLKQGKRGKHHTHRLGHNAKLKNDYNRALSHPTGQTTHHKYNKDSSRREYEYSRSPMSPKCGDDGYQY